MKKIMDFLKQEEGQALPLVALMLVVLLGFTAFSVDVGRMAHEKANLQKAVDAAALAGAEDLPVAATAIDSAIEYGEDNGLKAIQNHIKKDGDTISVTTPFGGKPNEIEVKATRTIDFTFAKVLGFNQSDIHVSAVAEKYKIDMDALDYTLFSGDDVVTVTSNKLTVVDGDIYGDAGIDAAGAVVNGEVVVNVDITNKTLDVASATSKIGPEKHYIPDLWPTVALATPVNSMSEFYAALEYDSTKNAWKLDNEVVRYEEKKNNKYETLNLKGVKFTGKGIIYSAGPMILDDGGQHSLNDSIIFYSGFDNGGTAVEAIHFTGSGQVYTGYLFAPNASILLSGTGATLFGRAIAKDEIKFAGGDASINGAIDESVFDLIKKKVRLID